MVEGRIPLLKRSLSVILALLMIIPTMAYSAEGYDPNATQGSGGNAETITGGTGFSLAHQGYRISILSGNQPFPGVAQPVQDMWYSPYPSDAQYYKTNRLGMEAVGTDNLIGQDNLDKINIPKAIILDENGNFAANGIAVREYLLGGSGGSPSSPGGTGGGGPTINWGGSSTPTRSQLAEKYKLDRDREGQAVNLARYYNDKLKAFYDNAVKDAGNDRGMTPDEFRERLNYFADKYRTEINNKFYNPHDWGVYGDGMEGYVLELLENNVSSLSMAYTIKYNRESQGHYTSNSTSRVKGAYIKEGDIISIDKADIPLAEAEGGSGETGLDDVPLTEIILRLFSDNTEVGQQTLIDAINSDSEFRILLESIVWYYPRTTSGSLMGIKVAGTARNIADFNLASGSLLGGVNGAGMLYLTNGGLPKGLLTEKDDTVLNLLMPTDPGVGTYIESSAIASNYAWGTHIYTKGDASTHTWDKDTYPDGTPGPAPDPGTPSNPGDTSDPGNPDNPEDPSNPSNPNGSYNITIIKFYESNNVPESNFTREHNPGTIAVEDEPIYHLVDWFYSPDRIDPPSQSTAYNDTKVQALVTGTGTSEATVNVVTPDTTLYLKLVKQDKAPANPTQQFILKESEVTKAYNSQQVQAGASWPTGDIFHWAGDSLGSGKCTAIIGYTCDCDDDDCSGCI